MRNALLLIMLILGTLSCSKSRKYTGDYSCSVEGHFYELNSYNIDTIYQELLEIEREKKSIVVLGRTISGDSLKENEWYNHSFYPSSFNIMVTADSMYIYSSSGGQGGGSSYFYSCKEE